MPLFSYVIWTMLGMSDFTNRIPTLFSKVRCHSWSDDVFSFLASEHFHTRIGAAAEAVAHVFFRQHVGFPPMHDFFSLPRLLWCSLPTAHSTHLRIRKVHLRMLFLELLQQVQLLLLVARGLAHLLLPLIEHHLLDHAPRLAVQIAQVAVLGLDLARVDLGRAGDDVGPPLQLVRLVEVDLDVLARGGGGERPGGVVDADGVGELALLGDQLCLLGRTCSASNTRRRLRGRRYVDDGRLALDAHPQGIARDVDVQVLALVFSLNRHGDVEVLDGLVPLVGQGGLLGLLLCLLLGVELLLLLGRCFAGHGA